MTKYSRFLAGFDIHGKLQDAEANRVFFEFAELWKPDYRICGGDLWDFSPLRKGASADDQRESLSDDFKAGCKWFNRFKPTHFLRGNHDERIYDLAEHGCGVAADFAAEKVSEIAAMVNHHKTRMLPYHKRDGVLRLGRLKMLHGFACGVNAARQTALVYGSCIFGHVHTIDEHSIPGLERRVARSVGCLCSLDLSYSNRQPNTLRQAHGFAYGIIDKVTGTYNVWQAEAINGRWIIPSDIVEI